jgi:hypothetical protein
MSCHCAQPEPPSCAAWPAAASPCPADAHLTTSQRTAAGGHRHCGRGWRVDWGGADRGRRNRCADNLITNPKWGWLLRKATQPPFGVVRPSRLLLQGRQRQGYTRRAHRAPDAAVIFASLIIVGSTAGYALLVRWESDIILHRPRNRPPGLEVVSSAAWCSRSASRCMRRSQFGAPPRQGSERHSRW